MVRNDMNAHDRLSHPLGGNSDIRGMLRTVTGFRELVERYHVPFNL